MDDTAKFAIAFCGILAFVLVGILGLIMYGSQMQYEHDREVMIYVDRAGLDVDIAYQYCTTNTLTKKQCAGWVMYPSTSYSNVTVYIVP